MSVEGLPPMPAPRSPVPGPSGPRRPWPSPEVVTGVIAVLAVAILGIYLFGAAQDGASADGPSSTAAPTELGPPSPSPLVDHSVAVLLTATNERLLRAGDALEQELDRETLRVADVASLIRDINGTARFGRDAVDDLGDHPATADLRRRLAALYDLLGRIAADTLDASIKNTAAYRAGAGDLVKALKGLPPLQARLDALRAGESPSASPTRSPSSGASTSPLSTSTATPVPTQTPTSTPSPTAEPTETPASSASPTPPASPTSSPVGPSQLVNGGFESGVGLPWSLRVGPGADATLSADNDDPAAGKTAARVDISAVTAATRSVVLQQGGIRLAAGASYEIRASVRSAVPRDFRIQVASTDSEAYVTRLVSAGPSWSVMTITFIAPVSDDDAVLEFALGRDETTTWIDEVYLGPAPDTIP